MVTLVGVPVVDGVAVVPGPVLRCRLPRYRRRRSSWHSGSLPRYNPWWCYCTDVIPAAGLAKDLEGVSTIRIANILAQAARARADVDPALEVTGNAVVILGVGDGDLNGNRLGIRSCGDGRFAELLNP